MGVSAEVFQRLGTFWNTFWNRQDGEQMRKTDDYDVRAKMSGLIIGISNEIYFRSTGKTSTVYMEFINDQWVAWRETYVMNSSKRKSFKLIEQGSFEKVIRRVENYLLFIERKMKESDTK